MSPHQAVHSHDSDEPGGSRRDNLQPTAHAAPRHRTGLSALLAAAAHAHPQRLAFIDPPSKPRLTGRAAIAWSYGAAAEIVARLANGLKNWRLPPGSRIGVSMADGAESCLAHLAVEAAGHVPCLLPLAWDEDSLVAAAQTVSLAAVLTQSRVGAEAPAERLRRVAARYFGLRYVAAFGPDSPDGVINLDAMALDGHGGPFAPAAGGLVTFAGGDPSRPIHRPADALLAAIAVHLAAIPITPGDRILSLLPSSDLRGHVAGLGAALIAGATLEALPLFDGAAFAAALSRSGTTHLVAPAALERNLAAGRLPETLRSITLAHRAPTQLTGRHLPPSSEQNPTRALIDLIGFDEMAILTGSRDRADVALTLADPGRSDAPSMLMGMRREPDGRLAFRGHACKAHPLQRDIQAPTSPQTWLPSPFRVSVLAGRATAITRG